MVVVVGGCDSVMTKQLYGAYLHLVIRLAMWVGVALGRRHGVGHCNVNSVTMHTVICDLSHYLPFTLGP